MPPVRDPQPQHRRKRRPRHIQRPAYAQGPPLRLGPTGGGKFTAHPKPKAPSRAQTEAARRQGLGEQRSTERASVRRAQHRQVLRDRAAARRQRPAYANAPAPKLHLGPTGGGNFNAHPKPKPPEHHGILGGVADFIQKRLDDAAHGLTAAQRATLRNPVSRTIIHEAVRATGPTGRAVDTAGLTDKLAKEAGDLVANVPASTFLASRAAVEAAGGHPARLKKLAKDYEKSSAVVEAARAPFSKNASFKEAARRAREHPLGTALEVSGIEGAIGRAAGAAARHPVVVPGKANRANLRRIGSQKRANLRLYPDRYGRGPEVGRRYSKDLIRKGVQVAHEKHQRRRGQDPNVDRGQHLTPGLRNRPGLGQVDRSHLKRRVDTRVFSQERARRARKEQAMHTVSRIVPAHRDTRYPSAARRGAVRPKEAAGVHLVAEGTARADVALARRDLNIRLGKLAKQAQRLKGEKPEQYKQNRAEAKHIRELLQLPDERLVRVIDAAGAYTRSQTGVQARAGRVGVYTETEQAKRFYPALQSRAARTEGTERRPLTREEQALAAKSLQRRARRGQELPPRAAAAVRGKTAVRAPKVGQAKGITRADFAPYLKTVRRTARTPARRLNEDELAVASKVLQRRARRGKETLSGFADRSGPALVTQRPVRLNRRGEDRGAYQPSFPAPKQPFGVRTGRAYAQGGREVGGDALLRQAVTAETHTTAAEGFQLADREFGVRAALDGRRYAKSYSEAVERARHLTEDAEGNLRPDAIPLVPVNVAALREFGPRLRAKQAQGLVSPAKAAQNEARAMTEAWDAALQESGRGRWILMPEDVVDRFRAHAGVGSGDVSKALGGITNLFKDTVLTTASPARWIGGNVADIGVRTAMAGITPLDIMRGRLVVRRAAEHGLQGEQAAAAVSGGGLYHTGSAFNRTFNPGSVGEHYARTIAAAPYRTWKSAVYALEHVIEELPQWGAVGKEMRTDVGRGVMAPVKDPVRKASPGSFERAITKAQAEVPEGYLTPYAPGDYAGMETYLAPDGRSGAAIRVHPNGDKELVNLFARKGAQVRGTDVLQAMERRGVNMLDATSEPGAGLEKFYSRNGWKITREEPWDTQYGPPPTPNSRVIFMRRDPAAERAATKAMQHDLRTLLHLHDQQIDHYARGLATDRALEARIQKATEDVLGRWGKVSPTMRSALFFAPFAQWLGAATRYVFLTLPAHHPIKTAMLAAASEMTEKERAALGLSFLIPRDKQVLEYQMGSIPTSVTHNKYGPVVKGIRTSHMTSFGTAAEGIGGDVGSFLFPQFSGPLDALAGRSFTGEQLTYPDWWPDASVRRLPIPPNERSKIAVGALLESTVPFASAFRRFYLTKGKPNEPSSTILTPSVRKKFDKETEQWVENEGTTAGGIHEWLYPVAPPQRLYDYGTGKAIEEQGIAGEVLDKWREKAKAQKNPALSVNLGRDAAPAPAASGAAPAPKPGITINLGRSPAAPVVRKKQPAASGGLSLNLGH